MVQQADLIFTGQVLSQRSEWREARGRTSIVTRVTVGVNELHKGKAGPVVTLQFLGGTVGHVTLDVAEMPRFNPGERVVLFVEGNGSSVSSLVGFYHGKFTVRKTASGAEVIEQHDGTPWTDPGLPGAKRGATASKVAVSPAEFAARIRELVANPNAALK